MKKCRSCGHENDDQATVCLRCKAALPHETNKTDEPVRVSKRKRSE